MQQQLHTGLLQFYCFFKSSPNFWGKKIHRQHWRRRWRRELTFQKLKTLVKTKKSYNWRYRKLSDDQSIFFVNVSRWPFFNFSSQSSKSKKFFSICSHSLSLSFKFRAFFCFAECASESEYTDKRRSRSCCKYPTFRSLFLPTIWQANFEL